MAPATKQVAYPLATGKLTLDKNLQRIIDNYAVFRHGRTRLFCLELEKTSFDTLQMSLYSDGNDALVVDFCAPSFYAEFDNKLVLISTGIERIGVCPSCSDAFYRIVTKKFLGKALTRTEYMKIRPDYLGSNPPVWRIIQTGFREGKGIYTVVDSLAVSTKHAIPPPAANNSSAR
ncbi:hypothetical protein [Hymenobacter daecheongensis]|uniref:hypothetical protein n=1 Tax=Hymenobacter daecheongensis TaxID=496053 RepID=UPI001161270F|nr:hypothetical protein [Hymenobacter daecheongensis]